MLYLVGATQSFAIWAGVWTWELREEKKMQQQQHPKADEQKAKGSNKFPPQILAMATDNPTNQNPARWIYPILDSPFNTLV